jgi:hypothetical protein
MHLLFDGHFKVWKSLDYILGFFLKARQYIDFTEASLAFVTTNSVCQGEQVSRFWPRIITNGVRINFAVTSFKWRNLASRNAGVTVCILGLSRYGGPAKLFDGFGGQVRLVENINAYLVPYRDIYVQNETKPLQGLVPVMNGSKPADGGGLIFDAAEAQKLRDLAADKKEIIRPFFGAHDAMHGVSRYCIWASQEDYDFLREIPAFRERFQIVSKMRSGSPK